MCSTSIYQTMVLRKLKAVNRICSTREILKWPCYAVGGRFVVRGLAGDNVCVSGFRRKAYLLVQCYVL